MKMLKFYNLLPLQSEPYVFLGQQTERKNIILINEG